MLALLMVFLVCSGVAAALVVAALVLSSRISHSQESYEPTTPTLPSSAETESTAS